MTLETATYINQLNSSYPEGGADRSTADDHLRLIKATVLETLDVIPGSVPNLVNLPPGCQFAPRSRSRMEYQLSICTQVEPQLLPVEPDHLCRCWLYQDHEGHQAPLKPS